MTKALDAAVQAAQEQYDDHGADDNVAILAALRAALPAEPPAELIEVIAQGMKCFDDWYSNWYSTSTNAADGRDWYRSKKAHWVYDALRSHLLGDEAWTIIWNRET